MSDLMSITASELFGPDLAEARATYRRLARQHHPDHGGSPEEMARLNILWTKYQEATSNGFTITTKTRTYKIEPKLLNDEIANIYPCSWERDAVTEYGYLRLVRRPANGDLLVTEAMALKTLGDAEPERFRVYVPKVIDMFRHRDPSTHVDRQALITGRVEGMRTLVEVHAAYPQGIDGRDAAWMWRRMLAGIGWCHQAGFVHGSILPENVLIHPLQHGVVFTNWSYSVLTGTPMTAIIGSRKEWYPDDVLAKKPVGPGVDVAMIAKCMLWVMADQAPTQMRAFAKLSQLQTDIDAWEVQHDFDELLLNLYGKRKYRPFSMPD